MDQIYFIHAIIPKDIKLEKAFVHCGGLKQSKFISEYNYAITHNKIIGRYKYVHDNGGLDSFVIVKLVAVKCTKEEVSAYKSFYQDIVDDFMDVALKLDKII